MKLNASLYGAAAVAGMCTVAFLALAAFLGLSRVVAPVYAALLTAAIMLLAAVAIPPAGRWFGRRRRRGRDEPGGEQLAGRVEEVLASHSNPAVDAWIRRHPDGAVAVTLALGIAAGYSDRTRRVLRDLYKEYTAAEQARRAAERG